MKKLSVLLMATAALGLTACSANKSTSKAKDTSSKNKSALIVHKHKAKGALSANNISPQENDCLTQRMIGSAVPIFIYYQRLNPLFHFW